MDGDEFSQLVEAIYDCVLDRSRWAKVFEQLCPRVGAHVAVYRQAPTLLIQHGIDAGLWATYLTKFARGNPWSEAALLYLQEGDLRALYRTVDVTELRQTRFYTDWLVPQGWGDSIAGMLSRSSSSFAFIAMIRPEADGPFGDNIWN